MKKINFCILVIIITMGLFSCKISDTTLDYIRDTNEFYDGYDYLFTLEENDVIFDFVIVNNRLTFVVIKSNSISLKQNCKIISTVSYAIEEKIFLFSDNKEYNWSYSSNLIPYKYKWCIVEDEFNTLNKKIDHFDFTYNEVKYNLCFQFIN